MRHMLTLAAALLVAANAAAQIQLELTGGVNEADLYESAVSLGYGFGAVPLTVGIRYGTEAPGFHRYFHNASRSAGVYARLEAPTWKVRPCVTAAATLTTFRGRCSGYSPTERGAFIQPGLIWQFHEACGLRLDIFRFGWWNDGPDTAALSESRWRTFALAFTIKMF